jgi:transposase
MTVTPTTANAQVVRTEGLLYMALELSGKKCVVGTSIGLGHRIRRKEIPGRDLDALVEEISKAKKRFGLPETAEVISCYEAGFEGFWLHRVLTSMGITNFVVKSTTLKQHRRRKSPKTDRLDTQKLVQLLIRHQQGEEGALSSVRVPDWQTEDERRLHRELTRLKNEKNQHRNRIRTLLRLHGVVAHLGKLTVSSLLLLRDPSGNSLPRDCHSVKEIERELARLKLVREQIGEVEKERMTLLETSDSQCARVARQLLTLKSIGINGAWVLAYEFFGWRDFQNRRQVGGLSGLGGVPYDSGESSRDLGISKEGIGRIRTLMVELSWLWLRWQKQSNLAKWFRERGKGKRARKVGIVAMARKLLVALWKYVKWGEIPSGAIVRPAL